MKGNHVVVGVLILLALIVATGYSSVVGIHTTVALPPAPVVNGQATAVEGGGCSAEMRPAEVASPASVGMEDAACARCPDGSPQCYSDRQCEKLCGGKGFGQCVQINSCYKCCSCAISRNEFSS